MAFFSFGKLGKLFASFTSSIYSAFRSAISGITDQVILEDLVTMVRNGDPIGAFKATGMSEVALRPIVRELEQAFEQAGEAAVADFPRPVYTPNGTPVPAPGELPGLPWRAPAAGAQVPPPPAEPPVPGLPEAKPPIEPPSGARTVIRFDIRDSRAEAWLRDKSSELIKDITDDTKQIVRDVLKDAQEAGINPRNAALDLVGRIDPTTGRRTGGVIGLNKQQAAAVRAARKELQNLDGNYFTRDRRDKRFDSIVKKAIIAGKPLTDDQIQKIIGRYSDSLLQLRGETIARTEMSAALNRSQWVAGMQAVDIGAAPADGTTKIWSNSADSRVRHDHVEMEDQEVAIDDPFTFPDGSQAMHPGDSTMGASAAEIINCRCRFNLKIDFYKGVK